MGTNLQNNLIVQFQGDVTTASSSVAISNDLERGAVVTATGAYCVIRNKNGSRIERVKGDAVAGVFTFTKRGLDQSDSDVEVSGLKKAWKTGQTMYITLLSSQIVDKQNSNTFGAGTTQTFVNTTTSGTQTVTGASAKIDASGAKLGLRVPNVTTAERILITTNGSIVYDTDIGVHYQYIGGAWSTFATGSVANASESVTGKVRLATPTDVTNGTDIEAGDPLVVIPSELKSTNDEVALQILKIKSKQDVVVATTANITLSGTQTIDGVSVTAGQRVLVKDQTAGAENGIYLCAAGAWTRAVDFDTNVNNEVDLGAVVWVQGGTVGAGTQWVLTTTGAITVGTTAIAFELLGGFGIANYKRTSVTSTTDRISANTERTTNSTTVVILKSIRAPFSGVVNVYEEIKATTPYTATYEIWINGLYTGTTGNTTNTTYTAFNNDITVGEGDFVQLYLKTQNAAGTAYVKNFRLRYNVSIGNVGAVVTD